MRIVLFACWLVLTLYLATHHAFWRDEVRAFSLALSGDNVAEMLRAIHGEGHPALWYLMLRGAHALVPVREVLPVVAWLIGAAAAALLIWRAPFRPAMLALMLFGNWMAFQYVVMARNYGIAMLVAFGVTTVYLAQRDRWSGALIGVLLALLCNTTVLAVFLAAGFLVFWLIDLMVACERRSGALRAWMVAAALTAAGTAMAFATVYPPYNDAASIASSDPLAARILTAFADPRTFEDLLPNALWRVADVTALLLALLLGSLAGLIRRPAALAAAAMVLVAMSLFFHLVYPATYRHEALFLVFLVSLYWLTAKNRGGVWPTSARRERAIVIIEKLGRLSFAALLALQLVDTAAALSVTRNGPPRSRSRDLGTLLGRRDLRNAIVLGHPDWVLEPLSYYAPNPTYMLRQHGFSRVARFSRHLPRVVSLDDYLHQAQNLQEKTGRPVLVVLEDRLYPGMLGRVDDDGLAGKFVLTQSGIARFLAATSRIARFDPAITDESYDVYLLR